MVNQTITISKPGANWASSVEADNAMRSFAGADTVAFLDNAKASADLVSFNAVLVNSDTLQYIRQWTDSGWASFSSRQADVAAMTATLESDGYTVTFDQPAYV